MKCINEKCLFFNIVNDANCSGGDDVEYAEECMRGNYCYFEPADLPEAKRVTNERSTYAQLCDVGELLTVCKQIEELRRMLVISGIFTEGSVSDLALRDLFNKAEKVRANFA